MNYQLERATISKKDILFNLLQFTPYDGSQYKENELNEDGKFSYTWFNNYFTDSDREAYFIRSGDKYHGIWEVEPIGNSEQTYYFWENTIEQYTNSKYEIKDNKVFVFKL